MIIHCNISALQYGKKAMVILIKICDWDWCWRIFDLTILSYKTWTDFLRTHVDRNLVLESFPLSYTIAWCLLKQESENPDWYIHLFQLRLLRWTILFHSLQSIMVNPFVLVDIHWNNGDHFMKRHSRELSGQNGC